PVAVEMLRSIELRGVVTASFHLDLYVGLNRENTLDGDPFWETGFVFTPDGDPASEAIFAERGIRHVWSPPAVWQDECVMGNVDAQFNQDVVFVGSYPYPHAEWAYRNTLVEWLRNTYGARFQRYGGGTTVVRNMPLNDLYRTARVVVGDSLCPGFTKRNYWSDRLTETLGRGGALVWPEIPGVAEQGFVDGEHLRIYQFGDFDQLHTIIDEMLADPEGTRAMAERGQAFVLENHTYIQRMSALLETTLA
ncbi:MAG TPA: glycosyltransferase, partial [Acidimicrobiia bacterium]|nr:glycosyltransferase [Acidimicrobiia bacterium]